MARNTRDVVEAGGPERYSDPPLLVLASLADGPKHGYAMIEDIERMCGTRLGPGTLYGAITRLERQSLIEPLAPKEPPATLPLDGWRPQGASRQACRFASVHAGGTQETGGAVKRAIAARLVRLYPDGWRKRYGEEFVALLEHDPPSLATFVNVLLSAVEAHMDSSHLQSG